VLSTTTSMRLAPRHGDIDPSGQRVLALAADLAIEAEAQRAVQETVARFGRLDVLANVAGVRVPGSTIPEATAESWAFIIGVNLLGVAYASKFAVPEMIKVGGGSIVNVSSANAIVGRPRWASTTPPRPRCWRSRVTWPTITPSRTFASTRSAPVRRSRRTTSQSGRSRRDVPGGGRSAMRAAGTHNLMKRHGERASWRRASCSWPATNRHTSPAPTS